MSPRSLVHARPRSLRLPTLAALGLIATVVAGIFATMVVTARTLDITSKAGRHANQVTEGALELERLVVDLETGVRGRDESRQAITARVAELDRLSPRSLQGRLDALDTELRGYLAG